MRPLRITVVLRHLGQLAAVLLVLLTVPTGVAWLDADWALLERLLLTALLPALVLASGALIRPNTPVLQPNEALVISLLTFVIAAALMTLPLTTAGLVPLDAWFEAVSGVTTTGLSMLAKPELQSDALLFARAWMQWIGGLGIVVLSLALAYGRTGDLRQLADATGDDDLESGVRSHARRTLAVYLLLTTVGLVVVSAAGMPWPETPMHVLAAISTGGFASAADSLSRVEQPVRLALVAVALCGCLPLQLWHRTWLRGPLELLRDPELQALFAAIAIVTALLWLSAGLLPMDAFVQAAMAQTTTGFSSVDVSALPDQAKLTLSLSMLTGAGVGSTAGGIKLLRLLILIRVIQLAVLRAQLPRHAVVYPCIGGRALEANQIQQALLVMLLFLLLVAAAWLAFVAAGHVPLDALFEVVSAAATVGLSSGITGPQLEPGLKLLLTLLMLAGRVEIVALLVLLYPASWFGRA